MPISSVQIRAGSSSYSPLSEGNLALWVDLLDPAAYSQSAGTMVSVTNKVSGVVWNTGTLPTFNATGINNLPAMVFEVTQYIGSTEATVWGALDGDDAPFTIFAVWQANAADRTDIVFSVGDSTQANNNTLQFGKTNAGSGAWVIAKRATATVSVTSVAIPVITPVIQEGFSPGTTGSIQINGAAPDPDAGALDVAAIAPNRSAIGCRYASVPDSFVSGRISEILVYGAALDSVARSRVRRYLGSRWSITVA